MRRVGCVFVCLMIIVLAMVGYSTWRDMTKGMQFFAAGVIVSSAVYMPVLATMTGLLLRRHSDEVRRDDNYVNSRGHAQGSNVYIVPGGEVRREAISAERPPGDYEFPHQESRRKISVIGDE